MSNNQNDHLNKQDLNIVLEVNRKAISLQSEVSEQNEEIIGTLNKCLDKLTSLDSKFEKLHKYAEEASKSLFEIKILFVVGILGIVGQIIQIILRSK